MFWYLSKSLDKGLQKAKDLLNRIDNRSHYRFLTYILLNNENFNEQKSEEAIEKIKEDIINNSDFTEDDFIIEVNIYIVFNTYLPNVLKFCYEPKVGSGKTPQIK